MTRTLTTVKRAAARKRDAHTAYRAAIVAARAEKHTLEAIAGAAGTTRQAVFNLLRRHPQRRDGE